MSSMYYRVMPEKAPSPRFGFKKVDKKEMADILSRVSRPKSSCSDRPGTSASTERPKSSYKYRRRPHISEQEWQRMIRRLQRPTISQRMARKGDGSVQLHPQQQQQNSRPSTQQSESRTKKSQSNKALEKLCRPTTASLAKSLLTCHLCEGNMEDTSKIQIEHFDNALPQEDIEYITERVRVHTYSSHPETRPCTRGTGSDSPDSMIQDIRLPLISGLDRSKTVNEIVERLQSGKTRRRTGTTATPITVL